MTGAGHSGKGCARVAACAPTAPKPKTEAQSAAAARRLIAEAFFKGSFVSNIILPTRSIAILSASVGRSSRQRTRLFGGHLQAGRRMRLQVHRILQGTQMVKRRVGLQF